MIDWKFIENESKFVNKLHIISEIFQSDLPSSWPKKFKAHIIAARTKNKP